MNTRNNASDHQSGVPGVTWDSVHQSWKVTIRSHGKPQSLGTLKDKEQAIAMRQEAEGLNASELQALKARYGIGGKRGPRTAHPWVFPAATTPDPDTNAPVTIARASTEPAKAADGDLAMLLRTAEDADADALVAQQAAERASQTALEAMQRAIACWNKYAGALLTHHKSEAFKRSQLGKLNGHAESEE